MANGRKRRRRITRRSSIARSNTTPNLGREPFDMAHDLGRVVPGSRTDGERLSSLPNPIEPFPSFTNSAAYKNSPTASIRSASTTSADDKKKHHIFSFKFKDNDRPRSSHGSPHPLSPLPPDTPVKALEMLGFDCDRPRVRSRSLGSQDSSDDELYELQGRPAVEPQLSISSLAIPKDLMETDTKPKEQNIGTNPNKTKAFWDTSTQKVQRMLGLRSTKASSTRHEADLERSRVEPPTPHLREESEVHHNSSSDIQAGIPLRPSAPQPITETPRLRRRKKVPKSIDRMPPITEASHDELRNSYNDYEHNPQLELISEYENEASYTGRPTRVPSLQIPNARYELNEEDHSPSDVDSRDKSHSRRTELVRGSADNVDFKRLHYQPPAAVYLRSPLQVMEDRLLDVTEANLAALRIKQDLNDASRSQLDGEVSCLGKSHRVMKAKFEAVRSDLCPSEKSDDNDSENGDEEDTASICSSIDLDEKPVICEAKVMTFTRVTPGMIKLVDIPPRRRNNATSSEHRASPVPPIGAEPPPKSIYCFKNGETPSPFKGRTRNGEVHKYASNPSDLAGTIQPSVLPSHLIIQKQSSSSSSTARKGNLPREPSRILSRDWISTFDDTKQRFDVDEPTNPQTSPPITPPPPPRTSSKEHYCVKNGHILHPVNLETIPDEAAINSLQVRPYLCTPSGRQQHVQIPVFCNRCGEDVKEEMWECDVAVCRMVTCRKCAMDMEREWKERVTGAWRY